MPKFNKIFHGQYNLDTRDEHPLTIMEQAFQHCATHHKKWAEMLGAAIHVRTNYEENLLKQVILQSMHPTVLNHFRGLTPDQQALPIRNRAMYNAAGDLLAGPTPNYYDNYFVPYFDIPTVAEHARNTLSAMRGDRSTTESFHDRLALVNSFYNKDPTIGYVIPREAYLNAYQNDFSAGATALRHASYAHTTWPEFAQAARTIANREKGGTLPSTPATSIPTQQAPPTTPANNQTSGESSHNAEKQGEKRNYTEAERRSFNKGRRFEKRARFPSHTNSVQTSPIDQTSIVNALKEVFGLTGGGQSSSSTATHGGGSSSSRVNTVQGNKPDRYEHNPKGREHWYKWFRVCSNCRRWCAHFSRNCQEAAHPDNRDNPPTFNNPTPLNAYPKDFSQAMDLARSERNKYGDAVKFNCRPEEEPKL